jgi:hypothetical protein
LGGYSGEKTSFRVVCGLVFLTFNMYILSTIALEIGTFFKHPQGLGKLYFEAKISMLETIFALCFCFLTQCLYSPFC